MATETLSSVSNALVAAGKEARQGYLIAHNVPAFEGCRPPSLGHYGGDDPFRWYLSSVGVGNLAHEFGPTHIHGSIGFAGLRSRIVLEDFHH
jgi:hypothetical protein